MKVMLVGAKVIAVSDHDFEMHRKAAKTTSNISNAFDRGTAIERSVHRWFNNLPKGDENLGDKERGSGTLEVDSDQMRAIIGADFLKTIQDAAGQFNVDHPTVVRHFKQLGKVKNLDK